MDTLETTLQPQKTLSDPDITAAVERLLAVKQGVAEHLIDVSTQHGIVTLAGRTDNLLMRERAEEIASAVRGVHAVVNHISIRASEVPDAQLRRDVEEALLRDAATSEFEICITARDGNIMLLGQVPAWPERQQVLRVARSVRGVCDVEDRLHYSFTERRPMKSDEELTAAIESLMACDHLVHCGQVHVAAHDHGAVDLTGAVGSAAERRRAIAIAWRAGAASVDAKELAVTPDAHHGELRGNKYVAKPDEDVEKSIRNRLRHNPQVQAHELNVEVSHGRVTLSGTVGSLAGRRAAEHEALGVVGVWQVSNNLRVRPFQAVADSELQARLLAALHRDPYLQNQALEVSVHNGRAVLRGSVDNQFEKMHAEEVAAALQGVIAVENRLVVPNWPTADSEFFAADIPLADHAHATSLSNADLEHSVHKQLFWSARLRDQEVDVRADNGHVTLAGAVANTLDRQYAALCAYEGGARSVDNQLHVEYGPPH